MYPIDPPAVYVHESVLADERYRARVDGVVRALERPVEPVVVRDRALYRTRVYSVGTGGGRVLAERGGRVSLAVTAAPISPVQMSPEYRWDEYDIRIFQLSALVGRGAPKTVTLIL